MVNEKKQLQTGNSALSHLFHELEKHHDFQVTLCLQNVSTDVKFVYIRSEIIPIICKNLNISQKYFASIGLSIRWKRNV